MTVNEVTVVLWTVDKLTCYHFLLLVTTTTTSYSLLRTTPEANFLKSKALALPRQVIKAGLLEKQNKILQLTFAP